MTISKCVASHVLKACHRDIDVFKSSMAGARKPIASEIYSQFTTELVKHINSEMDDLFIDLEG